MYQEPKRLWLEALRSGNYAQGQGALQSSEGQFCCLGVLCDIAVQAGLDVEVGTYGGDVAYDGSADILPDSVREWSGMDTSDGEFYDVSEHYITTLAEANDGCKSFTEIADLIEEHF